MIRSLVLALLLLPATAVIADDKPDGTLLLKQKPIDEYEKMRKQMEQLVREVQQTSYENRRLEKATREKVEKLIADLKEHKLLKDKRK